jgi:hypothetical protein
VSLAGVQGPVFSALWPSLVAREPWRTRPSPSMQGWPGRQGAQRSGSRWDGDRVPRRRAKSDQQTVSHRSPAAAPASDKELGVAAEPDRAHRSLMGAEWERPEVRRNAGGHRGAPLESRVDHRSTPHGSSLGSRGSWWTSRALSPSSCRGFDSSRPGDGARTFRDFRRGAGDQGPVGAVLLCRLAVPYQGNA